MRQSFTTQPRLLVSAAEIAPPCVKGIGWGGGGIGLGTAGRADGGDIREGGESSELALIEFAAGVVAWDMVQAEQRATGAVSGSGLIISEVLPF